MPASTGSGSIATQSRKIRLYPTAPQRALLRHWLGTARFVYNRTLDFLKAWQGKRPSWMEIATDHILPALPDWAEAVPYQIKKMAINEACDAYTAAKRKYRRTGESRDYGPLARPELHYKSRKCPYQTCYIPKTAVKPRGIYPTLLGTMRYGERLPAAFRDCKLSYPVVPLCVLPDDGARGREPSPHGRP